MHETLGDRMKAYEAATRNVLPRRTYTIIRVDGRAFHSYLRGCQKPYDLEFMNDMDAVATALCKEISGAVFAYTQSDEISVLITDFASPGTQPWFGGVVNKMVSISASLATAVLNMRRSSELGVPLFDSRAFTIPDPVEVANYFIWRQRDCVRNSITMAAQAKFSHKQLHGVTTNQMQEMLFTEHGINWNDYPTRCKWGRVVIKDAGLTSVIYHDKRTDKLETTMAHRTWWETQPAPHFDLEPTGFLVNEIPTRVVTDAADAAA